MGDARDRPDVDEAEVLSRLLFRAAAGDEAAWARVLERYAGRVFALARSRVRSADEAEEITQSVFVTVAGKLGNGGYLEQGRFEAWLFRIAMNRVRDEIRRRRRQTKPMSPDALPDGVADTRADGDDAELQLLRQAMGSLSEADREVVELRHHAQMSFKAMADLLGEPVGTVLARHHRALAKIRAWIEEHGGGHAAR